MEEIRMTQQTQVASYRCPYCSEATYPSEMLVRAHISWADDDQHDGHDGMTPEVEPIEVDAEGNEIGRAFTLPAQLNLHALSLADIPETHEGREFSERERRTLLVAAFNANKRPPYPELHDLVTAHLTEHGCDPLDERELRRLCEAFFAPHKTVSQEQTDDITTAQTTLRDLTALQQAIILAHLADPERDPESVATQFGTANSYPEQVLAARDPLISRLRNRLTGEYTVSRLIAERIPVSDLEEIMAEGYLDECDISVSEAVSRKPSAEMPSDIEAAPERHRGAELVESTETETTTKRAAPLGGTSSPEPTDSPDEQTDSSAEPTVPRAEVEVVRAQVAFDLAVLEREMELAEPTPQQARTKAYLEQILDRLERILS